MKIITELYDPMFDKDVQKYMGQPLKELLKDLDGKLKVYIEVSGGTDRYGSSGYSGYIHSIPWQYADLIIKDVHDASSSTYNNLDIIVEA